MYSFQAAENTQYGDGKYTETGNGNQIYIVIQLYTVIAA